MVKDKEEILVDYDTVSEFAGHQKNRGVSVKDAAQDLYKKVKSKAMQVAVKGVFINFDTIAELEEKLSDAVKNGFRIQCFDENLGG